MLSPWVAERRDEIRFALQVFPIETPVNRSKALIAIGQQAEALGYDAFIVGDHPAWGPECWVHLAALAATTSRIGLGMNVGCIWYRHPLLTARLAADLDQISDGRTILGLGVGWDENEFAAFGIPFLPAAERQVALDEAITIIRGVWASEEFRFDGRYFSTRNARIEPPARRIPILIAGGGERVTLRQVAQLGDACNLSDFGKVGGTDSPAGIGHKLTVLRDHCARVGRPYEEILRTHMTGWQVLAPDETSLAAKTARYFPAGIAARYDGPWRGFAVAETPVQAVARYQALVEAGIQYFIVGLLDAGDAETVRLLADEVIPRVRMTG